MTATYAATAIAGRDSGRIPLMKLSDLMKVMIRFMLILSAECLNTLANFLENPFAIAE